MRVCIVKATGKVIESQSGGNGQDLDALVQNAVAAGFASEDVEAKYIDDAEYATLIAKQREAEWSYADKRTKEYLPAGETLDALTKMYSTDPIVQEAGKKQMAEIADYNMAVKGKYPK